MPSRPLPKGTFTCLCILCLATNPDGCEIPFAERDLHLSLAYNTSLEQKAAKIPAQSGNAAVRVDPTKASSPATTSNPSPSFSPSSNQAQTIEQKRENNKATAGAHARLIAVEKLCRVALEELTILPDRETLLKAEATLTHSLTSFDKVTRNVRSVVERKNLCRPILDQLHARVDDLQHLHPKDDAQPIEINSGETPLEKTALLSEVTLCTRSLLLRDGKLQ